MNKLSQALVAIKGVRGFWSLVKDLHRTEEVFEVVSGVHDPKFLAPVVAHFKSDALGAAAFETRPRIGKIDLQALRKLPIATLGREYADHMLALGLSPDFHPAYAIKDEYDYMRMHLYETHDLWHVLTGFDTSEAGELGLQAFYSAQFPQGPIPPILMAAGLLNAVLFSRGTTTERMDAIVLGYQLGKRARPLFGLDFSKEWGTTLTELRARFGIDTSVFASGRRAASA